MDRGASVLVAVASLKNKTKQKKPAASFVDVQRSLVPKIMCLFMENDFMYLLYKSLESGDTPGLFEGWICVWICCEEGQVLHPLQLGGGAGRG